MLLMLQSLNASAAGNRSPLTHCRHLIYWQYMKFKTHSMLNTFKHNISIRSSLHAPINRSQIHMTTMITAVITTSSIIKILDYSQIRLLFLQCDPEPKVKCRYVH